MNEATILKCNLSDKLQKFWLKFSYFVLLYLIFGLFLINFFNIFVNG